MTEATREVREEVRGEARKEAREKARDKARKDSPLMNAVHAIIEGLVSPTSERKATSAVAEVVVEAAEGVASERGTSAAASEASAEESRTYEHPKLGTFKQYAASRDGRMIVFQDADGHLACVRAEKLVPQEQAEQSEQAEQVEQAERAEQAEQA